METAITLNIARCESESQYWSRMSKPLLRAIAFIIPSEYSSIFPKTIEISARGNIAGIKKRPKNIFLPGIEKLTKTEIINPTVSATNILDKDNKKLFFTEDKKRGSRNTII